MSLSSDYPYERSSGDGTFTLSVVIKNVRNKKGRVQLQLYKNKEQYAEEKGWKSAHVYKKDMKNNTLKYNFSGLQPGVYGIALLDDENKNTVMDYGWILPKEGFGFGDYYHTKWSTPSFSDFKFYLKSDKSVTILIRYL